MFKLSKLKHYVELLRLDKPIGIFLLLWPTLMALWIAAAGWPGWKMLSIFILGTVLMRSAGCAINDFSDKDFDKHVFRTKNRPLASKRISIFEAITLILFILCLSWILIIQLNLLTKKLAFISVFLATSYPLCKRFFPVPQIYLGLAFGFGIPMAFAAINNHVPNIALLLLLGNIFWTIAYDTTYAMLDLEDDLKIGIYSSAITFGRFAVNAIVLSYIIFLTIMAYIGIYLSVHFIQIWPYWLGFGLACYYAFQHSHYLSSSKHHISHNGLCKIFMQNNHLGLALFLGFLGSYYK